MHGAPSVSYPVGRSRFAGAALLAAWCAGAAGVAAWRLHVEPAAPVLLAAVAAVLLPGALALRSWLRSPCGTLAWSGAEWTWTGAGTSESGTPEAVLDLQRRMLLRWSAPGGIRWLWLERDARPAAWDDVRRAVYSRASPQARRSSPEGEARP